MLSLPDFREKQLIVCYARNGHKISFKNDNLLVTDAEGQTVIQTTCYRIFALWIVGSVTITSGLLERSKKFGFSVFMTTQNHKLYGIWNSATEGNFLLRRKQYEYNSIDIPRRLVINKIMNQQALLRSIRDKHLFLNEAIEKMSGYSEQACTAGDLQTLLGIEGSASRVYFGNWFSDMPWKGRKPRAKIDIINATLDIGYTYLFNVVECMLNLYGFDLYQGTYHRCFYQRKSLVCDLVEPFRCIIDKQVKRAHGLKQMKADDFREQKGQFFLKLDKNRDYSKWLFEGILAYKEDMFSYVQDYYRCFVRNRNIADYPIFKIKD